MEEAERLGEEQRQTLQVAGFDSSRQRKPGMGLELDYHLVYTELHCRDCMTRKTVHLKLHWMTSEGMRLHRQAAGLRGGF